MGPRTRDTFTAAGLSPEAARLSRYFDVLVLVAVFFTLTAAFHLHSMLSAGDWDMWVDWKDRRFWVVIMPVVWITFPAAVQYGLWTNFRLPIGATACILFLLVGTWITRVFSFNMFVYLPYSLMFPATALAGALAMDAVLLLTRNHFLTAVVGGGLFGFLFFPTNWPMIAPYHLPVEHLGQQVSVADLIGYTFNRTAMPEYLRIIERGTLRTYGDNAVVLSMFFSSFLCMLMYVAWWYLGAVLASPKFVANGLSHMMGLGDRRKRQAGAAAALLLAVALAPASAAAHGERAQEPFLRTRTLHWYDVRWSTTALAVNEEVVVTGRFRVYDEWPTNIAEPTTVFMGVGTPGASFARKASYIDGVPMIQSTGLELGRDYSFKYVLQARIPGRHHVHPMINVQSAGGLLGPGQWIEVRGSAADFRYPAVTLTGVSIPNLETYGLGAVGFWHILWGVIALAWVLWWIRRPLFLPRNALLKRGEEDVLVTPLDRKLAAILLVVTLVVVIVGFRWAEVSYPRTIPLQGGRVKLPSAAEPERRLALTLERATYDVPGRSMRLALKVTNGADQPIRLGELSTANVRFVNHDLPAAMARVDPGYPVDLLARTGLRVDRDEPIKPGESRVLQLAATDVAWETERLTSFLNDPDSRFGALLFFYEPDGTRRAAMIGGPIIPTFVRG